MLLTFLIYSNLFLSASYGSASGFEFKTVRDSVHIFTFNQQNNSWDFAGADYYFYTDRLVSGVLNKNGNRIPVTKVDYSYNNGLTTEANLFLFLDGNWVNDQHHTYYYDDYNILTDRVTEKWYTDHWQNLNWFNYSYNDNNQLLLYNRKVWSNNNWLEYSLDRLVYDTGNRLIERVVTRAPSDEYFIRTLYQYDEFGRRLYQIRQNFISGEWVNITRVTFIYDQCWNQKETITENWINSVWQNASRTVNFFHYETGDLTGIKKVPVCFKGVTHYIKKTLIDSFVRRGACLGECKPAKSGQSVKEEQSRSQSVAIPFIVFPNPAHEKVTVAPKGDDFVISRVELVDWNGNILRIVERPDSGEITILREGLISGQYVLRVHGDRVFSLVVVFN